MAFTGLACAEETREARWSLDSGIGKIEGRKKIQRRRLGLIARPGARGLDTQSGPRVSAKPRAVADAPGRPEKGRRRWGGGRATVPNNYRFATEFILQITLKFSKEAENLQKQKFLNFPNSTTLLQ